MALASEPKLQEQSKAGQTPETRGDRGGFEHLLVGFDGSDGSRDALELGRVLASPTEADCLVVRILSWAALP